MGFLGRTIRRFDRLLDRIGSNRVHVGELTASLQDLQREFVAHSEAARAIQSGLEDRFFRLERLVSGTHAARPPGAAAAVLRLEKPAVAIVMPTHNRAPFVGEAISSVLDQRFEDWELVVVDDGSTDGTEMAVQPFLTDPRIKYLRHVNQGASESRNAGIAATRAPLIAYLDDDNLWYPDFLWRSIDFLATHPGVDLTYGALITRLHGLDRGCIVWREFNRAALIEGNYIDTSVIVHRRLLVDRYGGWSTLSSRLVDWDLVLRYTADKPAEAIDVLAAYYREVDDVRLSHGTLLPLAEDQVRLAANVSKSE